MFIERPVRIVRPKHSTVNITVVQIAASQEEAAGGVQGSGGRSEVFQDRTSRQALARSEYFGCQGLQAHQGRRGIDLAIRADGQGFPAAAGDRREWCRWGQTSESAELPGCRCSLRRRGPLARPPPVLERFLPAGQNYWRFPSASHKIPDKVEIGAPASAATSTKLGISATFSDIDAHG